MSHSRVDLLLLDVDRTLIKGTLAEGDGVQFNADVVSLAEAAHTRGASVVLFSNHPIADDLRAVANGDSRLRRSVCGSVSVPGPKVLAVRNLLSRLGVSPSAAYLLDDDSTNVAEFQHAGIRATADVAVVKGALDQQPITTEAHRQRRDEIRRLALALYSADGGPGASASTAKYLRERDFAVDVGPCEPGELPRAAELFARTNQLHFNPAMFANRESKDVERCLRGAVAQGAAVFVGRLSLGGRDLGVQAAAIVEQNANATQLSNACLSCSVLPFAFVETIFVKRVVASAGTPPVTALLSETPYNRRVREILAACGGQWTPQGHVTFTVAPSLTQEERYFCRELPGTLTPEDGVPAVAAFFDLHVLPRIQERPGCDVLDLGHGYGEMLGDRRQRALDTLCQELGIRLVRSDMVPSDPGVVQLDAQAMTSVPNASTDFVFALELLEHVDRPADVLSEASRVLRPGGLLFLSVPAAGYPFHPFLWDRHRFTSRFLRSIEELGYRLNEVAEESIGDVEVRTILLAERVAAYETRSAHDWIGRSRRIRLADGLVLHDLPKGRGRRLWHRFQPLLHRYLRVARGPAALLVTLLTLFITIERVHNASVTQLLSTGVSMVLDESLYEQGLELLPEVQHAWLPYYDDMVARLIIAKLGHSRANSVSMDGARLIGPPGTAGTEWVDSVLDNVRLERTIVRSLQLRNVTFGPRSNFTESTLDDLRGSRVKLTGGLRNTKIEKSRFVDFYGYGLIAEGGAFTDVSFVGAPGAFNTASFRGVRFRQVTFTRCDFQQATFEGCSFDDVRFLDCDLSDAAIRDIQVRRVTVDAQTRRRTAGAGRDVSEFFQFVDEQSAPPDAPGSRAAWRRFR